MLGSVFGTQIKVSTLAHMDAYYKILSNNCVPFFSALANESLTDKTFVLFIKML